MGGGCNEDDPAGLDSHCFGIPNNEFRLALARPFLDRKVNIGLNTTIATGHTGRTVENFALVYKPGHVGSVPVPDNPAAEAVGVRIPSFATVNITYRFSS